MKSIKWGVHHPRMVKVQDHPKANCRGYVAEHVLIVEKVIGRYLKKPEEIHHVDLNPHNNSKDNLVLCQDTAYHQTLHRKLRALKASGHVNYRRCWVCKKYDKPTNVMLNGNGSYVHNDCWNTYKRSLKLRRKGVHAQ